MLVTMLICSLLAFQVQNAQCKSSLFSFVQIGDTQGANETQLQSIANFVVNNKNSLNIQYVVHMGDIVELYQNETDWEIKNAAFSQLTSVVPFGWLAGNHEGESQFYIGDDYYAFNVSNYPDMTSSYDQGRNTAQYFNFGSTEILFVNLDFFANETAFQRFVNLYQQYDRATVVFSTHSYLDFTGTYIGDTVNATYLDAYPRVKLVLCGHLPYALNQQINGRNEIRFDYQPIPGFFPDFSDYVRVYTVFDDGTVDAWTYSQLRDEFLTDSANQFSFSLFTPQTPTPLSTTTPSPSSPSPPPNPSATPTLSPYPAATSTPKPSPTNSQSHTPTPATTPTPASTPTSTPTVTPSQQNQTNSSIPIEYIVIAAIAVIVSLITVVALLMKRKR